MKLLAAILIVCGTVTVGLLSNQVFNYAGIGDSTQEAHQPTGKASLKFNPQTVIPRPFPAIKEINIESADKASEVLGDGELVLGVTIGEQSRAYPITMLCGPTREIINDEIGGSKIAATW